MNTYLSESRPHVIIGFRFLYGRWIHSAYKFIENIIKRFRFLYGRWIPPAVDVSVCQPEGSDSSMVDEYPTFSLNPSKELSSDSSMVDEYYFVKVYKNVLMVFRFLYGIWILRCQNCIVWQFPSSDSSMVDEYRISNIKALNATPGSDSSMVDEYPHLLLPGAMTLLFRFLYGRWIRAKIIVEILIS